MWFATKDAVRIDDGVWQVTVQSAEDYYKEKPMRSHQTERVIITEANIDCKMVPLVRWLNSLEGVITLHCCQGDPDRTIADPDGQGGENPYISFLCFEPLTLIQILQQFGSLAVVEVDFHGGCLRYCARFWNQMTLHHCTESLP